MATPIYGYKNKALQHLVDILLDEAAEGYTAYNKDKDCFYPTEVVVKGGFEENLDEQKYLISFNEMKKALTLEHYRFAQRLLDILLGYRSQEIINFDIPVNAYDGDVAVKLEAERRWPQLFQRFTLYRFWQDEKLLYVGKSVKEYERFKQHKKSSGFFPLASSITFEYFDSETDLARAEIKAIQTENPIYNKVRYSKKG